MSMLLVRVKFKPLPYRPIPPTFVIVELASIFRSLLVPTPKLNWPFSMSQFTVRRTLTVLFEAPLPMYKPLLQTLALVTVIVLLPPPAEPTVIWPKLENVTALLGPITFKVLLLAPAPPPTEIAPLP